MKFATKAIHAGQEPDPSTGAIMTPIFQTSTYAQAGLGEHKGHEYARTSNPTRTALEACIAALENGSHGLAFASGMAGVAAIFDQVSGLAREQVNDPKLRNFRAMSPGKVGGDNSEELAGSSDQGCRLDRLDLRADHQAPHRRLGENRIDRHIFDYHAPPG